MAYQAKKHKRFREDLELIDSEGNVVHTIHVELDADDMVVKINRKYTALTRALADLDEIKRESENNEYPQKALEKLGNAEIDLFESVFGEADTRTIIDFYEERYMEMAKEIIPFITHVVIPRIAEIKKENKKALLGQYNRPKGHSFLKGRR